MLYTTKLMLQDLIAIEYVVELHVRKFGRLALLIEHIFFFFFNTADSIVTRPYHISFLKYS